MTLGIGRRKRKAKANSKDGAKATTSTPQDPKARKRGRRIALRGAMLLGVAALAALPGSTFGDQEVRLAQEDGDDRDDRSSSGEIDWELGLDLEDPDKGDLGDLEEGELALGEKDDEGDPDGRRDGETSTSPVVDELTESGIPQVAMQAYRRAQVTTAQSDPSCGLRWSLLAAIGRVESNHGRYGGAELRADGYGTRPIRGIPLDGRPGVALIRDTDDGRLDGDTVYDRAVGPMQFIPGSWGRVAADGNGDGREDPNNIFDATLGAASYLCSGDRDLRQYADRYAAVRSYNHSDEYVRTVLALADEYERNSGDLPQTGPVTPSPTPGPNLPETPPPPASVTPPPQPGNVGTDAPNSPAPSPTFPPGGTPPTNGTTTTTTRPRPTTPTTPPPASTLPPCPTTTSTSSTSSTSSTTTTTTTTTGPTTTTTWPAHCPTTTTTAPSTSSTSGSTTSSTSTAGPSGPGVILVVGLGAGIAALTAGHSLRRRLMS